ncbi:hypothetical protein [Mycolicibacterium psychrotolerans]|uniref:hypothetical protein n=1 Tax=Mycolicibacterium psychrotolerans TaxID=216929 RepID=UPI0021F36974|nr:hypothetical protein [Mycolicibacterium psychrotolerans]
MGPPFPDVPGPVVAEVPADVAVPAVEAAPLMHAASVPAPLPGPVVPVVPVPAPLAAPAVPVPVVPLPEGLPGLPLLPGGLPVPEDLVCEGTAWSAETGRGPSDGGAATGERRDDRW